MAYMVGEEEEEEEEIGKTRNRAAEKSANPPSFYISFYNDKTQAG